MTDPTPNTPNTQSDESHILESPLLLMPSVVYPGEARPLTLPDITTRAAAQVAQAGNINVALFRPDVLKQHTNGAQPFGTLVALGELPKLDGQESVLAHGQYRARLLAITQTTPYPLGQVEILTDDDPIPDQEGRIDMRQALLLLQQIVQFNPNLADETLEIAIERDTPGTLADSIATNLPLANHEHQQLLSTRNGAERLSHLLAIMERHLSLLELLEAQANYTSDYPQFQVTEGGWEGEDLVAQEIEELRARVRRIALPTTVAERAHKEISRLAMLSPMAPEVGMLHSYIDWLVSLPWTEASTDNLDIANAERILNEDHYGLEKVKERVLEYIAVRKLAANKMQTPILCFLGPPGTGKTSLGKSIARALGRNFARVSLGGVRDEAEIRGHRRTYIGAMPGRIIQTMSRAGTINPVIMLDEIDKLGRDFHGDPAAALLEVLDPEQNSEFSDHYLDMSYDLSQVLFITTANDLYPLPPALEDRLEVIEFPGYIEEEKLEIARRFLIPKALQSHGLEHVPVKFEAKTLQTIIQEYTYEAGVRGLNRRIAEVLRKIARLAAENKRVPKRIPPPMLTRILGAPEYTTLRANDEDQIGVVTGLAWTNSGGDIMTIEVSLLPGKGGLQLTGQLGDVMQESAHAALSYLRRRAQDFDIPQDDFDDFDLHIHLPEGAVPKEGPSAGITLAIAMLSVFTERSVRSDVAMTGEITLRGKVLPVGGIREKLMAARRAKIQTIILPQLNERDLVDIPKRAQRDMNLIFVDDIDKIIDTVLLPPPEQRERDLNRQDDEDPDDDG